MPVVALVGAGSAEFTQQLVSDLLWDRGLAGIELRLFDRDPVRLARALRLVNTLRAKSGRDDVAAEARGDLDRALIGADYVINTVLVGGRDAVVRDFSVLEQYGIRQTVGDTLGVSGVMRAVRTIPQVVELAKTMERVCPSAVLLNYTNPLSMLVMALDRTSTIEHYGLCHSAYYTAETLADYLEVPLAELKWESWGINHMAWMMTLQHRGRDLYPALEAKSREPAIWHRDSVRFELMRMFGRFVTESSKHNAEYTAFFIGHDAEVERLNIPLYEYVTRPRRSGFDPSEVDWLEPSGEYAPQFIHHRELGTEWEFQGNTANTGLIDNLSPDAAVEVPCHLRKGRVFPRSMGSLPRPLAALNSQAITVQDLAVWGTLEERRDALYQAVAMDPQAGGRLTLEQMRRLVDALLVENQQWVPKGLVPTA